MQLLLSVQSENSPTKIAQKIAQKMILIISKLRAKVQSFKKKALSYI
jgi:hypothetical protein